MSMSDDRALLKVLAESQRLGFLGPGDPAAHLAHAAAFVEAVGTQADSAVELGSGGGVPGLVLVRSLPQIRWCLLDSSARRTSLLRWALAELGIDAEVRQERAEEAGRDPAMRAAFDLVVARGFGPPAVTAECAAPFLRVGGRLLVSEPPAPVAGRWPVAGLELVGLGPPQQSEGPVGLCCLELVVPCPDRFPRRSGVPARRPLF